MFNKYRFVRKLTMRFLQYFSIATSPVLRCLEFVLDSITKNKALNSNFQTIFIVGAPRTGSTILYQAITNAYNLAYIDNIACTWHRNLRFGMWLSEKKYGDSPHNNFKADRGDTQKFGGHAPSECGGFWYRWLPKEKHFIDHDEVTARMVTGIRAEVLGVTSYLGKPLLFKNLNAGQRLRLIKRALPDAKIIFVRRDPRFVVRSIMESRKKLRIREGQWWSIMPPKVDQLLGLPETEMVAAQVYFLEKQIEEDLGMFPADNVMELHYQDLNTALIEHLADWIGVNPRPGGSVPEFLQDSIYNLANDELEELNHIVSQYPFRKELFI